MSTGSSVRDRWRRLESGWPAGFPIAQRPNPPLLVALSGLLLAALTHGSVHAYARAAFYAGVAAWAYGELASGVNIVRRALGAGGLLYVVLKVGAALGA
jgi:hypothetical protein